MGDGASRQEKDLKEILPTISSSSRDPNTEYPRNYNVWTQNYMELILCFWMEIGKWIRLEQHCELLYMGFHIQRSVHLQAHHGKTIKSENSTRRISSTTS